MYSSVNRNISVNRFNYLVMSLNKSKGNMYEFVTHTWNTVKGACPHDCSYCYMKKWGKLNPVRFDEKELKTDLGEGNFIFVGSSCDMFADEMPNKWILRTLEHCDKFDNRYLFQTKNPYRFWDFIDYTVISDKSVLCVTIESNRLYPQMGFAPSPNNRIYSLTELKGTVPLYITIEPIMDFDMGKMIRIIQNIEPKQVNIGADSGGNNLPEPDKDKLNTLISELSKFTKVHTKKNLKRLL